MTDINIEQPCFYHVRSIATLIGLESTDLQAARALPKLSWSSVAIYAKIIALWNGTDR